MHALKKKPSTSEWMSGHLTNGVNLSTSIDINPKWPNVFVRFSVVFPRNCTLIWTLCHWIHLFDAFKFYKNPKISFWFLMKKTREIEIEWTRMKMRHSSSWVKKYHGPFLFWPIRFSNAQKSWINDYSVRYTKCFECNPFRWLPPKIETVHCIIWP